jgi:amino acid transporter
VVAGSRTGRRAREREPSVEDLLLPAIPGLLSSLLLEAVKQLTGVQKLAVGTCLGLLVWWVLRRRQRSRRRPEPPRRRPWRWVILALAGVTLLALVVTVVVFDRPTTTTAAVALVALGVLNGLALTGRRVPGAGAGAVSGALIGLCLGIALL